MSIIATFPWGWLGTIGDNELEVVSVKADPPKVRLAVVEELVESNLGSVCFNLRPSTNPQDTRHIEMGYVMGRLTANKQSGAMYVALAPSRGAACKEVLYMDNSVASFRVPVVAPNLGASDPRVTRFYTDGGQFCVNMQDDAVEGVRVVRAVKYLIVPTPEHPQIVTADERTWVAVGVTVL